MAFPDYEILDNFNRDNEGPPMTGWVDSLNGLKIVSNEAQGSVADEYSHSFWDAVTSSADCQSYCTIEGNDGLGVFARAKELGSGSVNLDGYVAYENSVLNKFVLYRMDDGGYTQLDLQNGQSASDGDMLGLECTGTTIKGYYNDDGAGWGERTSAVDETYQAAGYIGLDARYEGRCDDFGGGPFEVVEGNAGIMTPNTGFWGPTF